MLALLAAVLFLVAFILEVADKAGNWVPSLVIAGLFFVALHLAGFLTSWRRRV